MMDEGRIRKLDYYLKVHVCLYTFLNKIIANSSLTLLSSSLGTFYLTLSNRVPNKYV